MSSNEYNYDADAQFFPFFVLTLGSIITLPLTYSLLRKPSDTSTGGTSKINSAHQPSNADIIDAQRAKQKRKELRLKRMISAAVGWVVMAYMLYLIMVTARHQQKIWSPYDILDIGMSATEKQINSRYRKLSVTMHPDKRQPDATKNETSDMINDDWVEIVKAYKSLTDEDVRNNYIQYGNPDGKQSTSFGIALPHFLVARGNGKYVLVFYGALLGIGLPLLVGRWWYGMQKMTREKVLVTSAGNMFRDFTERMDSGDIVAAISGAMEYRDILHGTKADTGLGQLEKKVLSDQGGWGMLPKDKRHLLQLDDAVRRKTLALLWAYLDRVVLDDRTLETEKYELAPTALQMAEAFTAICLAYGWTPPVLASYELCQSLTQAIPPSDIRLPLLQLPHLDPEIVRKIERKSSAKSKEHMTVQSFMALPAEQRTALAAAAGLDQSKLKQAESVARQLPLLKVEKAWFKVQGESCVIPSSLVQFVIKARFIPPGTLNVPPVSDADLADPDPTEGDLEAQKREVPQHSIPLTHAPYLPRDMVTKWHIFLADNRQNKIAVPPFAFHTFDKKPFNDDGTPTFEVVTMKTQFSAPPQVGEFKFQMHMMCDSYIGFDHKREVVLNCEPVNTSTMDVVEEDEISEPEEDSIAGQMAALKGQPTADANAPPRRLKRPARAKEEESDYESGTDEDEDEESETDTDTDTDEE